MCRCPPVPIGFRRDWRKQKLRAQAEDAGGQRGFGAMMGCPRQTVNALLDLLSPVFLLQCIRNGHTVPRLSAFWSERRHIRARRSPRPAPAAPLDHPCRSQAAVYRREAIANTTIKQYRKTTIIRPAIIQYASNFNDVLEACFSDSLHFDYNFTSKCVLGNHSPCRSALISARREKGRPPTCARSSSTICSSRRAV